MGLVLVHSECMQVLSWLPVIENLPMSTHLTERSIILKHTPNEVIFYSRKCYLEMILAPGGKSTTSSRISRSL